MDRKVLVTLNLISTKTLIDIKGKRLFQKYYRRKGTLN